MAIPDILADGGYKSRKFILALVGMVLVVAAAALGGKIPSLSANYGTMVTSVGGIIALYYGANVSAKSVLKTATAPSAPSA